ncbi:S1C family serine protease [Nocardioides sp. Iso805N]|uniref:S1C family serine protease n=1 Tax=Nocardioides sp. Iso805N TaxID=1283287 RepID=UPI00035C76FC|nr:trypsin-like peptidase domain-containing protein [Nocardioides sp. Iso805N]
MNDFPPPSGDERPAGEPTGEQSDEQRPQQAPETPAEQTTESTQPLFGAQQPSPYGGQFGGPSGPPPPPPTQHLFDSFGGFGTTAVAEKPAHNARPRRRSAGLVAGVVAAAVVIGGGAGYAGAALYHHNDSGGGSVFSSSGTTSNVANEKAPAATQGSVEAVAKKVLPAVVKIEVSGSTEAGSGSGIIISSEGLIMTNNHVVAIAGKTGTIKVDFNDGSQANATIVGTDPLTDTAVIKAAGVSNLTPATIGKSSQLAVGQSVVAIGSPFGLDSTVTSGIVSALNRPVNVGSDSDGNATVYPAIQTDAAINPGNSGGALVDLNGNVVGINASIRSTTSSSDEEAGSIGLGFAIPIDEVMPIMDQMIKGETPTHARLGISVADVPSTGSTGSQGQSDGSQGDGSQGDGSQGDGSQGLIPGFPGFGSTPGDGSGSDGSGGSGSGGSGGSGGDSESDVFTTLGALVKSVNKGSAAATAGIKTGDIVTKVDDHVIAGSDSLVATIRAYRPGDKVTITWTHSGKTKTAQITLDSDASTSTS